jgi:FlaA1/EpsC-like NDP-sugar epimerase
MERAENALFTIDSEMKRRFPGVARRAVLHDVVDAERTLRLLVECRPHVVFHAAAHKHVPLMEDHPSHAIDNNVFGTKAIADASVAVGAERFVMISSDKAVNPTSVMGATKRLAELYVGALARARGASGLGATRLSMVRFGNVLGSACSVIPIWQQQLAEGGPLTVTDPRMTRYFMTIPEAATLVVQAAALASDAGSAPVYVLDMGEPVRIVDLAVRLAGFHGFVPVLPEGVSTAAPATASGPNAPAMPIVFTGIRPGEKLAEQLAYAAENLAPTPHAGITCWRGGPGEVADLYRMVCELATVRRGGERDAVLAIIRRYVPEMPARA